jgi:hypothetical protein
VGSSTTTPEAGVFTGKEKNARTRSSSRTSLQALCASFVHKF